MSENETDLALEKKKKGRKPTTNNYFVMSKINYCDLCFYKNFFI